MKRQKKINKKFGSDNPMWKGKDVGYASLHEYVRSHLPKPELCQSCGVKPALDLANKGTYDRDFKNWEWLCRSCHMRKDGRMGNLWRGIEDKRKWKPPNVRYGHESPNWKGGFRSKEPVAYRRLWQKHYFWKKKKLMLLISPTLGILRD